MRYKNKKKEVVRNEMTEVITYKKKLVLTTFVKMIIHPKIQFLQK